MQHNGLVVVDKNGYPLKRKNSLKIVTENLTIIINITINLLLLLYHYFVLSSLPKSFL